MLLLDAVEAGAAIRSTDQKAQEFKIEKTTRQAGFEKARPGCLVCSSSYIYAYISGVCAYMYIWGSWPHV